MYHRIEQKPESHRGESHQQTAGHKKTKNKVQQIQYVQLVLHSAICAGDFQARRLVIPFRQTKTMNKSLQAGSNGLLIYLGVRCSGHLTWPTPEAELLQV